MEPIASDLAETALQFSWPYKFYHAQDIQQGYNASHDSQPVNIEYDDEKDIFRLICSYDDIEYHSDRFVMYIDAYIQRELAKADDDLISGDPPQVVQLWTSINNRTRFYDLARRDEITGQLEDNSELIQTERLRKTIPYSNRVARSRHINKKLFDIVAAKNQCSLIWHESGLQILCNQWDHLQRTLDVLTPAISLLAGIVTDVYWADALVNLQFRLMKMAKAVDHAVYKTKNFTKDNYDLHLVCWDARSCQYISLRPQVLLDIEFSEEVRNAWHKHTRCTYGSEDNMPNRWMNSEILSHNLSSTFMPPEQLSNIQSWVTKVDDVNDPETQPELPQVPSVPIERGSNVPKIWAGDKLVKEKEVELLVDITDIVEEKKSLLDDLDLSKPRVRPTPRLKAAPSSEPSVSSSDRLAKINQDKPDFMTILVDNVAKLVSAIKLQIHEGSTLTVSIGQFFIPADGIPERYRPDGGHPSETFMPMEWTQFFGTESDRTESIKAHFSRRLTTSYDDALYMSTTVLKSTKRSKSHQTVFRTRAWSDRTVYRLQCQNTTTGTIAVLEVDNKQNVSIKTQAKERGFINIHFPEYMWDARISSYLTTRMTDSDLEAFTKVLNTVWIGNTEDESSQVEKFYARHQPYIKIISCQRRRERIHRTTEDISDEKAVHLHITRVEALHLASIPSTPGGFCAFSTTADSSNDSKSETAPSREQRLWFEAHLHSESINSILPEPADGISASYNQAHGSNRDQTFIPPAENNVLKRFLRSELAALFNATYSLVTEWNSVGSRDRAKAPVGPKGVSSSDRATASVIDTNTGIAW